MGIRRGGATALNLLAMAAIAGQGLVVWLYALGGLGSAVDAPIQWMPLSTIQEQARIVVTSHAGGARLSALMQLAGNMALLGPAAFAAAVLTQVHLRSVALTSVAVSATIEFLQWLASTGRTADVDDVLLNSGGCVLVFAATRRGLRLLRVVGSE